MKFLRQSTISWLKMRRFSSEALFFSRKVEILSQRWLIQWPSLLSWNYAKSSLSRMRAWSIFFSFFRNSLSRDYFKLKWVLSKVSIFCISYGMIFSIFGNYSCTYCLSRALPISSDKIVIAFLVWLNSINWLFNSSDFCWGSGCSQTTCSECSGLCQNMAKSQQFYFLSFPFADQIQLFLLVSSSSSIYYPIATLYSPTSFTTYLKFISSRHSSRTISRNLFGTSVLPSLLTDCFSFYKLLGILAENAFHISVYQTGFALKQSNINNTQYLIYYELLNNKVILINLTIQSDTIFLSYQNPSISHPTNKKQQNPTLTPVYFFTPTPQYPTHPYISLLSALFYNPTMKSQLKNEKLKSKRHSQSESVKEQAQIKEEDGEVKHEHSEGPKKWFEDSDDDDNEIKWEYLEHHGVTFTDPYLPKNLSVTYNGEKIPLNPYEEELAWYWCQTIGSDYEKSPIYRKNFQEYFTKSLKLRYPHATELDKFDFSEIKFVYERERDEKKNRSEAEKAKEKQTRDQLNRFYGYAIVDGTIEKVNGYQIQPPTLFKGRGQHPKAGCLKPRIQPQEITLNLAEDAPIPKCHVAGHSWGSIDCKKDSTWLCSYKNDSISSSSTYKYIFLAANSKFKGQNDRRKYEKARKLKRCIADIRKDYLEKIDDKDIKNKQLGTATYLIDKLALRVGNQKGEDQADTQGCCSLRVEHIENLDDNEIKLDFLGKDSMRYINTVKVIPSVWRNIQLFRKDKGQQDDLFDKIDAQALNDYLKSLMEGLTAKVFRTYNASSTLQQELKKFNLTGLTLDQKVEKYDEANKQVAILCNHQKTVGKKFVENLTKKEHELQVYKEYLKELQMHKSQFSAKRDHIKRDDQVLEIQGMKSVTKKFPETKQATESAIKKLQAKLQKEQKALKKRDEDKQIAKGTSKTNYNDPRISVAWCKKNEVKIEKIFPKTLLSKFLWAMYSDADFEF